MSRHRAPGEDKSRHLLNYLLGLGHIHENQPRVIGQQFEATLGAAADIDRPLPGLKANLIEERARVPGKLRGLPRQPLSSSAVWPKR